MGYQPIDDAKKGIRRTHQNWIKWMKEVKDGWMDEGKSTDRLPQRQNSMEPICSRDLVHSRRHMSIPNTFSLEGGNFRFQSIFGARVGQPQPAH